MTHTSIARKALLACLLLAFSFSPARGEDKGGFAKAKIDGIAEYLKDAVDKKKIAGASGLIFRKGETHLITIGQRDIESKALHTPDTIFRIASMSKPITSVAVMILVEDGKVKVTDPLSKYVPEFKDMKVLVVSNDGKSYETVKADREITIHDLLTHTSGITYRLLNKPFASKMYADAGISDGLSETSGTIGDNIKKLAKMPLVCQPGAAWEYGLNTDVLGYVIEVASGKTLDEFLRERIFKPLQMNDTHFILPKEKRARLSAIHTIAPDKSLVRVPDKTQMQDNIVVSPTYPTNDNSKYYSGGAGLVSTIQDYLRFGQMLLNRGELNRARILKAETIELMTKNQLGEVRIMFPGADIMGYGFGVVSEKSKEAVKDPAAVGTFGWGGAFGTSFWVDPKNEMVGVFMTQIYPPDFAVATEFKKRAYEALLPESK